MSIRVFSEQRVCNLRVQWVSNQTIEIGCWARSTMVKDANNVGGVCVQAMWLGRDIGNGC